MTIEERLKIMMCEKCGTVLDFSKKIGIPNSTTANILKRGIRNAGIENIIKICEELEISVDELANGRVVRVKKANEEKSISDAIENGTLEQARLVICSLIEKIELDDDDVKIYWKFS